MSTALDALFAGRVFEAGHAVRRTTLRHFHMADPPLAVAVWRLGGERFRAAAVAWGPAGGPFKLAVAGEPRNRDLYFAALVPFAKDLNARAQRLADVTVARHRGKHIDFIPADALQIVVPNRTTISALGLLGRYLAYLSDRGGVRPDPALLEAGKHLRFYARHARVPGQSLMLPLDRLVSEHWATLLSPFEQANLAALNAQIDPPRGIHAFEASAAAEAEVPIGPEPTEDIDRVTMSLLSAFNEARAGNTDSTVVMPLLVPLREHYSRLVQPVWELMGTVVDRERRVPEAPSVQGRFEADREAFGRHMTWVREGGHYRTVDTPRQAAMTLRRLEEAQSRYEAEKAIDDAACMVPHLLNGSAIRGTVASLDDQYMVTVNIRPVRRALIALDTDVPVLMPTGKRLWWTATAHDHPWEVRAVEPHGAGSRVVLQLCAPPDPWRLPTRGDRITLSALHTGRDAFPLSLPRQAPWTHRADEPAPEVEAIDAGDDDPPAVPVDGTAVADTEVYA